MKRIRGFRRDGAIDRRFGKEPPTKKNERNNELIADYRAGMGMTDVVIKYHITASRAYQLLELYGCPTNRAKRYEPPFNIIPSD